MSKEKLTLTFMGGEDGSGPPIVYYVPLVAASVLYAVALNTALALVWCAAVIVGIMLRPPLAVKLSQPDVGPLVKCAVYVHYVVFSAIGAAFPIYLWFSGEYAQAICGSIILSSILLERLSSFRDSITLSLCLSGVPVAALVFMPLVAAQQDPRGEWGPYIASTIAAALFVGQVIIAWRNLRRADDQASCALVEARRQEALSRMVFDQASVCIGMLDRDFRIVHGSSGFWSYHGGSHLQGKLFFDEFPHYGEKLRMRFAMALAGEELQGNAMPALSPTGAPAYVDWKFSPCRDESGEIIGIVVFLRDVTESVLAQKAVVESAERLNLALDVSGSVVWEITKSGDVISTEGDVEKIFGRNPGPREFKDGFGTLYPEEDKETMMQIMKKFDQGLPHNYSFRVLRPDGSICWIQSEARPYYDAGGVLDRWLIVGKDINERKLEELQLLEAVRKTDESLESRRALLEELSHENGVGDALELEELAAMPDISAPADNTGSFKELSLRMNRLLTEISVRDEALGRAVRSLRKAREASESANVAKSQFLANMSHELRTPLNAIIGYSEIMLEDAEDEGREAETRDHQRVLAAARSLLVLINEILDLSKIEAGRMDVSISDYEIRQLIEDAVETIRPLAEKNGNTLKIEIDPALETGRSDAFKLTQCLLNLLSNASKFTQDGAIVVKAALDREMERSWLSIAVTDTGIGMNDEQAGRLFQPFMQADASTTRKYGGTGLGLVIARHMMQLLGGDIALRSTEGVGSTFTLRAPLHLDDCLPEADEEDHGDHARGAEGPVVLVIDDEADVPELVNRSLTRLGFQVIAAQNAASGLRAIQARKPAIVLLDINLPDRSGWHVLEQLRNDPATRELPVIVHSVHDDKQRALSLGACAHFVKPADRDVLAAAVARYARVDSPPAQSPAKTAERMDAPALAWAQKA